MLGDDELAALSTGRIDAEVSDLPKPENRYEQSQGKLLEVYLPIETPSGEPLLFEAYYRYSLVSNNGNQLWRSFAPIALGSLIALELVLIPLAYSLARRLRQKSEERELLLRQALEASDVERRHIASDLHDGVVQDLPARRTRSRRRLVERTVTPSIRRSWRTPPPCGRASALRSLVIDIYPPDFGEVTLESALTDLLAVGRRRGSALTDLLARTAETGIETELDATELQDPLPDPVARLHSARRRKVCATS